MPIKIEIVIWIGFSLFNVIVALWVFAEARLANLRHKYIRILLENFKAQQSIKESLYKIDKQSILSLSRMMQVFLKDQVKHFKEISPRTDEAEFGIQYNEQLYANIEAHRKAFEKFKLGEKEELLSELKQN